ncbi:MAG: 2-amino-4-hydroxy-6-hydroxymethyldihydropteridine diphosphokinase [Rhizobiaceae bacterium]
MTQNWRIAWIGLGGNVGDVPARMKQAIEILASYKGIDLVGVSSLYATEPWGLKDQADFKNACIEISTCLDPSELLDACLKTESRLERIRDVRWGPRTIDLDILMIEGVEIDMKGLTVPHSRLHERAFALAPLAELAPDMELGGSTVSEILESLDLEGVKLAAKSDDWFGSSVDEVQQNKI